MSIILTKEDKQRFKGYHIYLDDVFDDFCIEFLELSIRTCNAVDNFIYEQKNRIDLRYLTEQEQEELLIKTKDAIKMHKDGSLYIKLKKTKGFGKKCEEELKKEMDLLCAYIDQEQENIFPNKDTKIETTKTKLGDCSICKFKHVVDKIGLLKTKTETQILDISQAITKAQSLSQKNEYILALGFAWTVKEYIDKTIEDLEKGI